MMVRKRRSEAHTTFRAINALLCVDECKCWFAFVHSVGFTIPIQYFNRIRIRVWARSAKSYMLYWAVCCLFRYDWFSIRFIIIHSILLFLILYFGWFFLSFFLLPRSVRVLFIARSPFSCSWIENSYIHMLYGSSYVKQKYTTAYVQFVFRMLVITDNTENTDKTTDLLYNKCCAV